MLEIIVITALVVATIILALRKWGVLNWYGAHLGHISWLPAYDCYLCLGFWMAAFFHFPMVGVSLVFGDFIDAIKFLLVPFCSTAISTYLTHAIIKTD